MAVTLTVAELRSAIRLGDTTEETAQATRLLAYATEAVSKHLGSAFAGTPDAIVNEAVIRIAAYLYDQPNFGIGIRYANALRNSGAGAILLPYRIHRAGTTGEAVAAAATSGSADNPVINLAISGSTLTVTYADGTTTDLTLPAGGGMGGGITQAELDAAIAAHRAIEDAHQPRDTYTLPAAAPGTRGGV